MERKSNEETRDIYILLERIKTGDREAFMKVVSLYQRRIFSLAFSFFQNREDALDIVQETFLRLYQKIHYFKMGKSFQNWIFQIAKNLCIDYYRKNYGRRKERDRGRSIEEMNLAFDNAYDSSNSSDLKEIFSRCLKKLSKKQRMIVVMKHYNQLKYREIAQILSISPGTVKSLHFKAVQNLKGLVSPYLEIDK